MFIVGAPRCGTSAMNAYLSQHPEIYMANVKESNFFAQDLHPPDGPSMTEQHYLALFSQATHEKILGESSVGYLYSKTAARRISEFNPQAKIIIMLRNPVEMVYSYHSRLVAEGFEEIKDFSAAVAAERERRIGRRWPTRRWVPKHALFYSELGKFSAHLQRFFDLFGRSNIHVIIFDEFKADTARVYRETCKFLGVSADFQPDFRVINSNKRTRSQSLSRFLKSLRKPERNIFQMLKLVIPRPWRRSVVERLWSFNMKEQTRPEISPELEKRLRVGFAPDVKRLAAMLGCDLTDWLRG